MKTEEIQTIDTSLFDSIENGYNVFMFSAPWCGKCRGMKTILSNVYKEFKDKFNFYIVSSEEETEVHKRYGIKGIPVILIMGKDKNVLFQHFGILPEKEFKETLENLISKRD